MGYYRARRVDGNQLSVATALREAGCGVLDLSSVGRGCGDLLVHPPGQDEEYLSALDDLWKLLGNDHAVYRRFVSFVGRIGGSDLMEVKNKKGRGDKLTPAQVKFHAEWPGKIHRVTSPAEALAAMGLTGIVGEPPRKSDHAPEPDRS